jgi:hypothetical protein
VVYSKSRKTKISERIIRFSKFFYIPLVLFDLRFFSQIFELQLARCGMRERVLTIGAHLPLELELNAHCASRLLLLFLACGCFC